MPPRDVAASAGWANLAPLAHYDRLRGTIDRNATHRLTTWLSGDDPRGGPRPEHVPRG